MNWLPWIFGSIAGAASLAWARRRGGAVWLWSHAALLLITVAAAALWHPGLRFGESGLPTWFLAGPVVATGVVVQLLAQRRVPLVQQTAAGAVSALVVMALSIPVT